MADILVKRLLEAGFTIQRYDAYSTNSIYLKLDYGACNSIRISDHEGKKNLSYRYNIGFDIKDIHTKDIQYPRHYFPAREHERLAIMCINDRQLKKLTYGYSRYRQYMKANQVSHVDSKGFWAKAKLAVKRGGKIYYEN